MKKTGLILFIEIQQEGLRLFASKFNTKAKNETFNSIEFNSIESVIQAYGNKIPYFLLVNGNGVLTRLVENAPQYKEQLLVAGNIDDFYFSSFETNSTIGVSFIRKHLINSINDALVKNKVFIFGIHIGPIVYIANLNFQSYYGDFIIEFEAEGLTKLEKNNNANSTQSIHKELATNDLFNSLFVPCEEYIQALSNEECLLTFKQYKEKKIFNYLGVGMLAFFLMSLTVNYFYINHLNQIAADKEFQLNTYSQQMSQINHLKQEKDRKIQLYESSGLHSKEFISFYLNEIGKSVPPTINLTVLETFPIIDGLKSRKKIEIDRETISIIGVCNSSNILDDWIEKMERFHWVKSIELLSYLRLEEGNSLFQLKIKL